VNTMEMDYKTISKEVSGFYTNQGSRFYSFGYPVKSETEIKHILSELKFNYPDATHHCYSWILKPDRLAQRMNDDGEPSNSAGRPIMRQINALSLTNVLVVVVRYFGGKKLGIPGLIEAYGESAKLCLQNAEVVTKTLHDHYRIVTDYENEHVVYTIAKKLGADIKESTRSQNVSILLSISGSKSEELLNFIRENNNFEIKFLTTE